MKYTVYAAYSAAAYSGGVVRILRAGFREGRLRIDVYCVLAYSRCVYVTLFELGSVLRVAYCACVWAMAFGGSDAE